MSKTIPLKYSSVSTDSGTLSVGTTSINLATLPSAQSGYMVLDYDSATLAEEVSYTHSGSNPVTILATTKQHTGGFKVIIDNTNGYYQEKADTTQPAWIAPTLLNSWANVGAPYNNAGYMKDSLGFVHLRGLIKTGSTSDVILFVLPAGYRPIGSIYIANMTLATSTVTIGAVLIDSAGNVKAEAGGNTGFSLENIIFKAEV